MKRVYNTARITAQSFQGVAISLYLRLLPVSTQGRDILIKFLVRRLLD